MAFNGPIIFRSVLLIESAANIGSIIPMFLTPATVLSYLVKGPSQITPATKSLTQWFGGVVLMTTVPLLLSYPDQGASAQAVTARRRITYTMFGVAEAVLGLTMATQYVMGDSGMADQALLTATGMMASLSGMRAFFLFMKPEYMEAQHTTRKTQ